MSLTIVEAPQWLLAAAVGLALLVVPGFALDWIPRLRLTGSTAPLFRAFVVSVGYLVICGSGLTAFGYLDSVALAIVGVAGLALGAIPAARWSVRAARGRRRVIALGIGTLLLCALTLPWIEVATADGIPQSSTFQWYYWTLGRQLAEAGGVPAWVVEYGREIRWLPDYVGFNVISETYRSLLSSAVTDTTLVSAFRVVPVVLGLVACYQLLRRWLGPAGSLAGVAALVPTVFFTTKFNVYKPESLGIVLGVVAIWWIVTGVRTRSPMAILLAGLAIGLAMSIHAIAATVMGLGMAGIGAAEWLTMREQRTRTAAWLVLGALAALVVVGGIGWAIQGRLLVAGDALRPELVDGVDPTWIYLNRSIGNFDDPPVPPLDEQLATGVLRPWPGIYLRDPADLWLFALIGSGVVVLLFAGGRRARTGLLGGLLFAIALVAAMLFFAVSFETYVPRHTGLARFGQYVPILFSFGVGFAFEGYLVAVRRIAERPTPVFASTVAVAVAALLVSPLAVQARYADDARFGEVGDAALVALQDMVEPNDVVLTNAVATGWLEFYLAGEAPFEGRQPLIEDVELLGYVNQLLLDFHVFLTDPDDEGAAEAVLALGPRWFLISNDPSLLGTRQGYGGTIDRFLVYPFYRVAWRSGNVAIFEHLTGVTESPGLGPALDQGGRFLVALGVGSALVAVLGAAAYNTRRRRRPPAAEGWPSPAGSAETPPDP